MDKECFTVELDYDKDKKEILSIIKNGLKDAIKLIELENFGTMERHQTHQILDYVKSLLVAIDKLEIYERGVSLDAE